MRRVRRYSRAEAQAIADHYIDEALSTQATTLPRAVLVAEARLNRAARRALGGRGDGSFHPLARPSTVVRSRNRW